MLDWFSLNGNFIFERLYVVVLFKELLVKLFNETLLLFDELLVLVDGRFELGDFVILLLFVLHLNK